MEPVSASSSFVISKKTGALVFFVGCAVGLIISEILVGLASQRAQQDAHRASLEYTEQVRNAGNGSFSVKQQIADQVHRDQRRKSAASSTTPRASRAEAIQSSILAKRTGTQAGHAKLERTVHALEKQKLKHEIEEEGKLAAKSSGMTKSETLKVAKKIPDTIGLIRIKGSGNDGILTHICSGKNDKNCKSK